MSRGRYGGDPLGCSGWVYCVSCGGVCSQDLLDERPYRTGLWAPTGIVTTGASAGVAPGAAQFCNLDGSPCLRCGGDVRHLRGGAL